MPGGHVLAGGREEYAKDGRVFVHWRDQDLRGVFAEWGLMWWVRLPMHRFWVRGNLAGVCAGDPPDIQTNGPRAAPHFVMSMMR